MPGDVKNTPSATTLIDNDANNDIHPLLQRHYGTIGIGDVFLSGPSHALPLHYLNNRKNTHIPSFHSWETVGTIKSEPEDFVVREIGLPGRKIPFLTDEQVDSLRVAHLVPINETDVAHWDSMRKSSKQRSRSTDESAVNNAEKSFRKRTAGPNETLEADSGSLPETRSRGISPREVLKMELAFTNEGPDATLEALDQLNKASIDSLGLEESKLCNSKEVLISILSVDLDQQTAGFNRGAFHNALRETYPLLVARTPLEKGAGHSEIRVISDDTFFGLIPFLYDPKVDIPALYAFYKCRRDNQMRTESTLVLKPDLPRSERRPIHRLIDSKSNSMLVTDTKSEYPLRRGDAQTTTAIVVKWGKAAARRAAKKRKRLENETNDGSDCYPHILVVMKKRQREHLTAIQTLSAGLRCRQADIGLAGIKDMQAVTYQFCTITNCNPRRLLGAQAFLKERGLEVGTVHKVDWTLRKADLEGNRFEITLRNVRRVQVRLDQDCVEETLAQPSHDHLQAMVDRIAKFGFINFYGEQRLGPPGHVSIVGVRASDIGQAMLQQDFMAAIDLIMTGRLLCNGSISESEDVLSFRQAWKDSKGDATATIKQLPKGAALARERIVLKGLKRYGKDDPLAALKCLQYNERMFWISAYQSRVWNKAATARIQEYGSLPVEGDLSLHSDGTVRVLSKEEAEKADICRIVLPMPGYGVIFPANKIGALYIQMLENDGVSFKKNAPPESTAKGSYRHLVAKAQNISFSTRTEDDKLQMKIRFDLPRGSYATMLLRELMITTVARDS